MLQNTKAEKFYPLQEQQGQGGGPNHVHTSQFNFVDNQFVHE